MPTLADIRAKLPDLEGLDDEQAISVIQQVYYPTVPVEQIAARLGYKPAASAALPERTKLAAVGDTAIETVNAAIGGIGSIGSFVAPGNPVSEFIDAGIVKPLQERQSDRKKAINARLAQDIAGAQGVGDQVGAALRYAKDDPAGLLGMAAGSFAIPLGAIKGAGMLAKSLGVAEGAATKAALAGGALTGAALSGGDAAGQAYEESLKAGATEEQAQAAARQASVIPAIVGGAGGMLPGAERIVAGAKGFKGNAISRALKTGASEGAQEFGEEFATQYEANRAVAPYDGRDPMQGAVAAGTLGALAGAPIGMLTGAVSPRREDEPKKPAPTPEQKAAKVLAAGSVDEAIKEMADAVKGPRAKRTTPRNALDEIRMLDPAEQQEAMGLLSAASNPRASDGARRFAQNRLDALLLPYRQVAAGESYELEPDQTIIAPATPGRGRTPDEIARQGREEIAAQEEAIRRRFPPATGEATEILPTGDATELEPIQTPVATEVIPAADAQEIEPIPAGDASEEIPAPNAYEVPPVGEATEVIPTGDAMEVPRIPTGKATEIEPETVQADDLLTGDGMPYGSKTAANVRARREGLGPANVIEIPGAGWVVRPQPKTLGPEPINAQPAGTRGTNAGDVVKRAESTVPAQPTEGPGSDAGNGFKQGPKKGERYRVGVVAAAGGAVTLEKRYPAGTAATFYVGKDGNLIDGDSVNFIGDGRSALWIPPTPELAQQAQQILDEMGRLELTDPARKDAKARLKALVLQSGANPNAKAPDDANPARAAGPRPADAGRGDGAGLLRDQPTGNVAGGAAAPAGQGVAGGGAAGPGAGGRDEALTPGRVMWQGREVERETVAALRESLAAKLADHESELRTATLGKKRGDSKVARALRQNVEATRALLAQADKALAGAAQEARLAPAQQNLQDRLSDARRIGKEAAERGDPRDPPEAFTGMEKQVWRAGWDQGRKIGGPTPQVPALEPDMAALRKKWPGLKGESDERILAAEEWDKAQNRVRAAYEYRGTVASDIQDAYVDEVGQAWIAKNQTAYNLELARRLNAEADRVQALQNTPGTLENKRAERKSSKQREDSAAAADKALSDDITFNIARVRELERQGRLPPAEAARLLELARGATDKFDAAMRLEGFVADKQVAPGGTLPVGRSAAPANEAAPTLADRIKQRRAEKAAEPASAGRKGEWRPSAAEVLKVVSDATPYGKPYTGTEGQRQKARIVKALEGLGLKPREAQSVLDKAMTTEAQRRMPTMRFILNSDVRDAADALGYIRPADAPAKRDEYPLGKTDRDDRFFGTRVRVLPELKGDTAWEGVIQSTLNGGRLFAVKRADSSNGTFRIGGDRLEILEVKDAEKADTKPKEPTKAPASINLLPLAEKWDALVAHVKQDGGDPDKGQRSYRALTQFIGRTEEKPLEIWDRWSSVIGSTGLVDMTGPQVLKWMESSLPTVLDGYIGSLPGNTLSVNAGDASYWQKAMAEMERRAPDHNRYVDRLERQALDVEMLGGDADKVATARKVIYGVKQAFGRNERTVQQGLAMAERREKEQAEQRETAEAAKYKPFDAKELSKKPTPASMSGWFTANYEGKTVWTQGTILDLSGEPPHLAGYESRRDTLGRNKDGKLDVSRVIPRERGPEAVPFGFYDGEFGKTAKNGIVYFDAEGRLVGADATFFRYFASKFKGATYFASPAGDVITVRQGGKTVGVLMPIKLGTDAQPAPTLAEMRAKVSAKPAPAPAPQPEVDAAPAAEPVAEAPALPNPWEISQDEFVSRVTFTKEGSSAFPWVAKWGDRILEAENEVFDHPDLGKTVVQGGRFSKTKREAEVVARGAHKRAVRRGVLNGNKATTEALSAYPDLLPAEAPAPERDERTIELRKRASVLRSLRECLG